MKIISLGIAALLILVGLPGVLWPEGLMDLMKYSFTSTGIYVAAITRMVLGALLLVAAQATRTSTAFTIDRKRMREVRYHVERIRGYDSVGELQSPGYFRVPLGSGASLVASITSEQRES